MRGVSRVAMVVLGIWAGAAQADSKSFERAVPAEPRGVVDISNVSGRIEVIGWDRPEVNVRGELVVSLDSARSVRARTTSGDLHFEGKLTRGADLDATSVSGDLKVRASAEAGYSYEARSVSGDITNCFAAQPVERHHGSGHTLEGTRGEGAGDVRLKTLSGEIQLCDRK